MQKKMAPTDIHLCLLNGYGDQTVDVSTVMWWVVHFSSDDSGSPLLVLIFDECSMQLSFIPGESALLMAVTVLKNSDL